MDFEDQVLFDFDIPSCLIQTNFEDCSFGLVDLSAQKMQRISNKPPKKSSCEHHRKRSRVMWTQEMHEAFVRAVNLLGKDAVPKSILQEMGMEGLTREMVASHLQKYRLKQTKEKGVPLQRKEKEAMKKRRKRTSPTLSARKNEEMRINIFQPEEADTVYGSFPKRICTDPPDQFFSNEVIPPIMNNDLPPTDSSSWNSPVNEMFNWTLLWHDDDEPSSWFPFNVNP